MDTTISKGKLKAHLLEVLRSLEDEGGKVIVTDHGKPTVEITPVKKSVEEIFVIPEGFVIRGLESLNEPNEGEWPQL